MMKLQVWSNGGMDRFSIAGWNSPRRILPWSFVAAILLISSFAIAQDKDWKKDDSTYVAPGAREAVPDMPPIPDVVTPPPTDTWTLRHWDEGFHEPQEQLPAQLKGYNNVVTEETPLEVDVFYSMRSPYSYLALYRLAYLHSNYNVNVNIRVIFPIAVRTRSDSGESGLTGRWYYFPYSLMDMPRTARYQGIPFRFANPDPILQDIGPTQDDTWAVAPMEEQPYITWLVRLAIAAQLEGKALEYVLAVSPLIWGARTPLGEWPLHVEDAVNSIGMDYDAVIEDIQKNPEKYDAVWSENSDAHQATGQGGVPTMAFNNEPFFGQDRFNQFYWRLLENGLTARKEPRAPLMAMPLRWPEGM
jgi:2-hydroxychromene-2-carboxylate isomerase